MSRLKERYEKDVVPALRKEFGYGNVMAIPKVQKIVVNMGLGEATQNAKIVDTGVDALAVLDRLAHAHIDHDLLQARRLKRVLVAELLHQVRLDHLLVLLAQTAHLKPAFNQSSRRSGARRGPCGRPPAT